ncbi:MAG TPA: dipeptide/oligopeptide/nickel ABC transporter permease/ATP-binding protein [Trebonia sp.]|jgi:peptide/nickel transport system permease protein|nr:dipeptide/oligopeptide/nickel ABC transporter permease/ATP-binding protein [Trebonia sp.]
MVITPDVEAAAADPDEPRPARSWLRGLLAPKVFIGLVIVGFFVVLAIVGPLADHTDPSAITSAHLRPPSLSHLLGTTQQGQDVLAQLIYGARVSMEIGFAAGLLTTLWSLLVGVAGGYLRGAGSELLSMFANVFLVLPGLPLVVIMAAYLPHSGSLGIIIVITVTGWAWGARVIRAQTLSLRRRDFVEAARATGESAFKIMLYDILPNEMAIITVTFLSSVVVAILTEASIAFLGLSNVTQWSWGTMLYWAQVSGAELAAAWWWFVPPGLAIALVGTGLAFINFGVDDVINPRLRSAAPPPRPRWARTRGLPWLRRPAAKPVTDPPDTSAGAAAPAGAVLELRNLRVEYRGGAEPVRAVNDVSLTLRRGEILGIAGESGSGKSTMARAITRLLKPPAEIVGGEMTYTTRNGERIDIAGLSDKDLRKFRWEEVSIVFQSAMNALNPVLTLGTQIDDVLRAHRPGLRRAERVKRVRELLGMVGISPDRAGAYPHELSGGMRQRAMIAMGLALDPEIVVMDEPTTALDVVIQRQVIETIARLKDTLGFSVIFITHDLSLLIELCDTIAIMYAGRIVELATSDQLYQRPLHPYSKGLLGSFPTLAGPRRTLSGVPGYPPDMRRLAPGCSFQPRCPHAFGACGDTLPRLLRPEIPDPASVACLLYAAEHAGRRPEGLTTGGGHA